MTIEVSTNVNPIVNLQVSTTDPQNPTVDVDVPGAVVVGVDTTVLLGPKGDPGFSPIANVTKSGSTATITITDEIGTTTASISDGAKGDTGDSGVRISTTEPTDPVVNVWINPNGSETQYVEDVKVNGTTVVTDKVAEITMPTQVSDLTNDSNFQTGSQVTTAITSKTQPIESTITTMQTSMTSLGSTVTTMQTTMSSYGDVVTHNANEFYASNNPSNYQTGSQVTTAITSETNPIKSTVTTMQTTITNISSTVTTMQTTMSNYGDVVTHDADEFYSSTNPSGYQTSSQVTTAISSSVIDNVTTPTTNAPLSANMGKELQQQVNNLKSIGRFLALWNCATGLAMSNPTVSPRPYNSGDYFVVGNVSIGTNYRPSGTEYVIGQASTIEETEDVEVNDVYFYDGTNWVLQINHGGLSTVSFENITGQPSDNTNLNAALNAKVTGNNAITGATATKITYDSKGLVTGGTTLATSDIPDLSATYYRTTNPSGYISGITGTMVTTALGYTPYNSTNPSGYQTASQVNTTVTNHHDSTKQDVLVSGDVVITKKVTPTSSVSESISVSVDGIESSSYSLAKAVTGTSDDACTYGVAKLYGPSVTSGTSTDGTFNVAGMHQFANANYLRTNEDNTTAPSGYNFFKTNSKTLQTVSIATKFNADKLLVNNIKDSTNTYTYTLPSTTGTIATETYVNNHHDSTKYDASNPDGFTSNTGTVTSVAVKMNGTTKGTVTTSGTIDLGTVITSHQDISGKENTSNKVTTLTSSSTNTQYPSAKCVYDIVGNIETLLQGLR